MKILAFAGSLRTESFNKKLAREALRVHATPLPSAAEFVDLRDYQMPIYDGDQERAQGIPDAVHALAARIGQADGLIIATPEYHGGMSSVLKNTIDWLSRVKPMPLRGKHLLLMSASPGGWGGVRGLWHSRVPFEALGVHVFPEMLSVPSCATAFDESGHLNDPRREQLQKLVESFVACCAPAVTLRAA